MFKFSCWPLGKQPGQLPLPSWPKAIFTVAWGNASGLKVFRNLRLKAVFTCVQDEYGLWPKMFLSFDSWGVAPGYGDVRPLAKKPSTTDSVRLGPIKGQYRPAAANKHSELLEPSIAGWIATGVSYIHEDGLCRFSGAFGPLRFSVGQRSSFKFFGEVLVMSAMPTIFLLAGVVLAGMIVAGAVQVRSLQLRIVSLVFAMLVLAVFFTLASFQYVGENSIGMVTKNIGFKSLPPGQIIATEGEKGPQARILGPGWHPWYWPFIYKVDKVDVIEIEQGTVGMLTAADGKALPPGATYAPVWEPGTERDMQNAEHFLTDGGGFKGPQTSVLKPGKYRFNPKLFKKEIADLLTIRKAEVGVVKSNVGISPPHGTGEAVSGSSKLVDPGQRGIWRTPLIPDQYYDYSHTKAYQVTTISTRKQIKLYTAGSAQHTRSDEESEIMVRTSDGFTFPVDVRIEYEIHPNDAPLLVASVGDDQEGLRSVMNSVVRAIFRNNAEGVKALNYVQERSKQESQSKTMLQEELSKIGVTITGVRIGDVGNEETLGNLLKTQTDREIALQEQETFREQQRAAEQKKQLTKTEQEAEEEKRLATAAYEVQIAEQNKMKVVIAAEAEAESVKIKADAQANAYKLIAEQIGSGNAALIELLKIIGERNISITPKVMVVGQGGGGSNGETTALIGTMLNTMVDDAPKR